MVVVVGVEPGGGGGSVSCVWVLPMVVTVVPAVVVVFDGAVVVVGCSVVSVTPPVPMTGTLEVVDGCELDGGDVGCV